MFWFEIDLRIHLCSDQLEVKLVDCQFESLGLETSLSTSILLGLVCRGEASPRLTHGLFNQRFLQLYRRRVVYLVALSMRTTLFNCVDIINPALSYELTNLVQNDINPTIRSSYTFVF